MTPADWLSARKIPVRLVIFDCDGVIVDSEPVANRITAASLTRIGWAMTAAESQARFLGMTLTDMQPMIEAFLGHPVPDGWKQGLTDDLVDALSREAVLVAGAMEALHAAGDLGLAWRIASNSSHAEMRAKFSCLGMSDLVAGRVHSHRDVGRGKPAPDLFLAAAAAEAVPPGECLVIEDSVPGVRAAAAAGMACLGYAPHSDGTALRQFGAVPFRSMFELPALFALAAGVAA